VIGILIYAWSVHSGSVLAVALLVAGAAFLGGALLGFLFGIPRSLAVEATPAGTTAEPVEAGQRAALYRSNTNLEQISDWLTKILVGVGLVELGGSLSRPGALSISSRRRSATRRVVLPSHSRCSSCTRSAAS
jgi:hypothetical protein